MKKHAEKQTNWGWSATLLLVFAIFMVIVIVDEVSFEYRKQRAFNDFLKKNLQDEKVVNEINELKTVHCVYNGDTVSLRIITQPGNSPGFYGLTISSRSNKITYYRSQKDDGSAGAWLIYKEPQRTILSLDNPPFNPAKPDITVYRTPWKEKRFLQAFWQITQGGSFAFIHG